MSGTASVETVSRPGNVWLDAILWGTKWDSGSGGKTVVSVYIGGEELSESVPDGSGGTVTASLLDSGERVAMIRAMSTLETVCNIDFRLVGSLSAANVVWASVNDEDGQQAAGWANPPNEGFVNGVPQSLVAINWQQYETTFGAADFLARGGYDFNTFTHELGHAVGLAHPHDDGGGSTLFPGLATDPDGYGQYGMNQTVFTMMSYNGGWATGPQGVTPNDTFGQDGGPMALDIAALQYLYGANRAYHRGDDTYRLPDANKVGTYYTAIWDAGGTDTLLGAAHRANAIDLRAASLERAPGGGGWMSYAEGIHGGYSIAHGVVVENATGGARADAIQGNTAANLLRGLGGSDLLRGGGGNDDLRGGTGADRLNGGSGADRLAGGDGADRFVFLAAGDSRFGAGDTIDGFQRGLDRIDLSAIDARPDVGGVQHLHLDDGGAFARGEVRQVLVDGDLRIDVNLRGDATPEMTVLLSDLSHRLGDAAFLLV